MFLREAEERDVPTVLSLIDETAVLWIPPGREAEAGSRPVEGVRL